MDAYSYELQLALVADGRGLGLVPKRLLDASAFRRRLAPVQVRGLAFPFGVWMVERGRSQAWAEVLAALRHVLVAQFDSHDAAGHTSRQPRHAASAGRRHMDGG